jgi:uncharacterized protein YbjT (DUF2867 family)
MGRTAFIAGATGYMGARLAQTLVERGHSVRALARAGSERKLPAGLDVVLGNALDAGSYQDAVAPADTFIHLVGTPHPAPWKEREFVAIDLASLRESVRAAQRARIRHFVFVSVAHPAPVMKAYIRVRSECERIIADSGIPATILRPWYVLGPGHRWPVALKPFYWLSKQFAATREGALRLGLVTREEMVRALVCAAEHPVDGRRILEVLDIRRTGSEEWLAGSVAQSVQ